ncbi:MAG: DNA replication/repair protein RecF [Cyanobacteria bacterium SZAS-4]|nr:DNA replication/repair protein RecF [Cyanobacteria bacterium SZAS-4]
MRVKKVSLTNFRNYKRSSVDLSDGRNVLIGENAQGKTNFLEAIEIISLGRSTRAQQDGDLIRAGETDMRIELVFESGGAEAIATFALAPTDKPRARGIERQIKVNGLTIGSAKSLRGRLVTVSFKSSDLNLLRGGPKFRRDWIDDILITLRPAYQDILSKYLKSVAQRNRLLKLLFEKGRVSVEDQDQLRVWDEQTARLGATIIKHRLHLLNDLLPRAERHQEHISGKREKLTAEYIFRAKESKDEDEEGPEADSVSASQIVEQPESELAQSLMVLMKQRRYEEIARKQTLCGPHRDDIKFSLNGADAVEFASQGQQRSLVLACKLAELERVQEHLSEPPILLLDDVLAELDLNRQGLLMSLVKNDTQTLITTTHVTGFKPEWVEGAHFLEVFDGNVEPTTEAKSIIAQ